MDLIAEPQIASPTSHATAERGTLSLARSAAGQLRRTETAPSPWLTNRTDLPVPIRRRLLSASVMCGVATSVIYFSWWTEVGPAYGYWMAPLALAALAYTITQIYAAWYLYVRIDTPEPAIASPGLTVDVFIPICDEPDELVERSLEAAVAIRYPHRTYLLDDASQPRFAALATRLGAEYLTREGNDHAKAGNVNAALARTTGEFVAIFDVDHVPEPEFLDTALGHFADATVGFVQSWVGFSNESESFVARAAAEQAYDAYGPASMGMHGCGAAPVWGSNCTFRRAALESIGGHQVGLAEDLHTSMRLHAAGWRSVFVPALYARGLVPADLAAFCKQQLKWARGVFEMLFEVYPTLCRRLKWRQNCAYLVRLTYFLIGPVFIAHALAAAWLLVHGDPQMRHDFTRYLIRACPLVAGVLLVRYQALLMWDAHAVARGVNWRGYTLACALWPVHTLALACGLFRIRIPHIATAKVRSKRIHVALIVPQLIAIGLLLGAIAVRFTGVWMPFDLVVMLFAGLAAAVQTTALYAAVER